MGSSHRNPTTRITRRAILVVVLIGATAIGAIGVYLSFDFFSEIFLFYQMFGRNQEARQAKIEEYHATYFPRLREVFEENKSSFEDMRMMLQRKEYQHMIIDPDDENYSYEGQLPVAFYARNSIISAEDIEFIGELVNKIDAVDGMHLAYFSQNEFAYAIDNTRVYKMYILYSEEEIEEGGGGLSITVKLCENWYIIFYHHNIV